VDETTKDHKIILDKFYDVLKNYKTTKPLEDFGLVDMSVEEFGNMSTKIYGNLSVESRLFQNMSI
jgi:hypothetical protein